MAAESAFAGESVGGSVPEPISEFVPESEILPRRRSPLAFVLVGAVRFYQLVISPWLGPSCRFEPSCSVYALDALRLHGGLRGLWLTIRRLGRCQPFCVGGYDPVPEPRAHGHRFTISTDLVGALPVPHESEISELAVPAGHGAAADSRARGVPAC